MTLPALLAAERRIERRRLGHAALCAASVATSSVLLLGLSGWFITAAALAGAGGVGAAQAFNYMLPSATIRLLAIVRTSARYGERLAGHAAAFAVLARLRPALFRALASAPPERALALGRGEATARLIGDVDAIELRFVRSSGPWGVAAAGLSGTALAALGGWAAASATLACLVGALWIGDRLANHLMHHGRAVQRATGLLREATATFGDAAAELRCYGLEPLAAARIAAAGKALADAQIAQAGVAGWFEMIHASAIGLAAAAALSLSTAAGAPIAALAALAAAMTVDAAAPLLRGFIERGRLREAETRLGELLVHTPARPIASVPLRPLLSLDGTPCASGERLALVGASGTGKTTLVEMLVGLRPAIAGRAMLGGIDLASHDLAGLRAQFAWAPQDAALIAGTVRDNLRLADPDADEAGLWEALKDAALDDMVRALPHGLDSWLGDDGARLSGGERRRLSLARAYVARAPWLLLDEPGEGLDAATLARVAERLRARLARTGQGLILVSHAPCLTDLCDRHMAIGPHPARTLAAA